MGVTYSPPLTLPNPAVFPGPITEPSLVTQSGGVNSSAHAAFTSSAITSGTPFTPNASFDSMVQIEATAAAATATLVVTYGPSTGAENTWLPTANLAVSTSEATVVPVPAGWKVIATITGVGATLANASIHRY